MLRSLIVVALAGSALAGADSFAQGQAIVGIQSTTQYSLEGRIAAADVNARTVTIPSAGTNRMLTDAGPRLCEHDRRSGNQPGRGRRQDFQFARQLVGRERRSRRQHHRAGQSRWRRSAHLHTRSCTVLSCPVDRANPTSGGR
jgi:hypothetical protein